MPVLKIDLDKETQDQVFALAKTLEIRGEDVAEMAIDTFMQLYADGQIELVAVPEVLN
jgi:hypothetical protein